MRFFSIKKFPPFLYTKSVPPPLYFVKFFILCIYIRHKFFGHEKRPHDSGLYYINIRLIYEKLYWAL